jgi:hypothetical protein
MTLPTFVVIGAMKAGTVSLSHYLDEHPDVFLGRGGKLGEPNFFTAEYNWPRGRGWYESLFDGAGQAAAIGECSPSYTMAPAFRGVPERMAQVILAVDPAAADLDERHRDHRSMDKPVPRLHDLKWLPRRQLRLDPRWRPDQRTGLTRLLTTRRARADDAAISPELRDRLAERPSPDLRRFEHLLGHQVPSDWSWSTSASA